MITYRNEKSREDLKQYLLTVMDYLIRDKKSLAWCANGFIYNVPFTPNNRPAFGKVLSCLLEAERLIDEALGQFGEIK